jgi:hypothetical protein
VAIKRSTTQQNQATLEQIQSAAASYASHHWLPAVLKSQGQNPKQGVLVRIGYVDEQMGVEAFGIWLSSSEKFWEFSVTLSRQTGAVLSIESFDDATPKISVSEKLPGTGRSFGSLALQVLKAR